MQTFLQKFDHKQELGLTQSQPKTHFVVNPNANWNPHFSSNTDDMHRSQATSGNNDPSFYQRRTFRASKHEKRPGYKSGSDAAFGGPRGQSDSLMSMGDKQRVSADYFPDMPNESMQHQSPTSDNSSH